MKLLDRVDKIDEQKLNQQINEIIVGSPENTAEKIRAMLKIKSLDELHEAVRTHESALKTKQLLDLLADSNITNSVFDISLMRGFDYYTDIVFEVFDTDPDNNRSMFGGGRYDGLVGLFGVDLLPTVGFGMGDVTLQNFLETHKLLPDLAGEVDLAIILIGDVYAPARRLATKLREMDLNVAIDATDRKLDKKIKSAEKQGVRYVVFVGDEELKAEQYPLKDLLTGKEEKHGAERIASLIKDYRS